MEHQTDALLEMHIEDLMGQLRRTLRIPYALVNERRAMISGYMRAAYRLGLSRHEREDEIAALDTLCMDAMAYEPMPPPPGANRPLLEFAKSGMMQMDLDAISPEERRALFKVV
jgi:hypothetical protein